MPSPEFLSPEQFSILSSLSIATVRRYVRAGKLPHIQLAGPRGRILIPSNALVSPALTLAEAEGLPPNGSTTVDGSRERVPPRRPGPSPAWKQGRSPAPNSLQ